MADLSLLTNLQRPITAKTLVLDLMRASIPHSWPIKQLIEVGELFGFSHNAVRVNVTRLLAKQVLEQDERGSYRLAESAVVTMAEGLQNWREGEARLKTWQGDWLQLQIAPGNNAKQQQWLEHVCLRFGFRQLWSTCWLRPNNLALSHQELIAQIASAAGHREFMLCTSSEVQLPKAEPLTKLWDVKAIEDSYQQHLNRLQQSEAELGNKPTDEFLVETFVLGGEGIHMLVCDPLLPAEMFNADLREQLTAHVAHYDAMAKPHWIERFSQSIFNKSPAHWQPTLMPAQLADIGA